jgi:hypothetical protein
LAAVKPFSFLHKGFPDFVRALGGDLVEAYRQAPLTLPPEDLPDLGFRWPKYILSWPRIFYDLITHSSRRRGCAWLARFKKQTDELDRLDLRGHVHAGADPVLRPITFGKFSKTRMFSTCGRRERRCRCFRKPAAIGWANPA